ncbi:MAG: hypothetical protein IT451_09775, partial [Candidatus Brocadia sp.]|nr:hypothetical protein [Candidatus Brocadia sp.]
LETALKLLFDFYGKQKNEPGISLAILVLIARACYERSVLILSKQDKVMVEKKKRIIKKGVEFVNKAIAKESNNKEALRLKSKLLLDLEKIDKDDPAVAKLKEVLSRAIQDGCIEFNKNAEDIEIALRFAEIIKEDGGNKPLPEDICESLKNIVDSSLQTRDIELKKAKAHYLLGNDTEVINCMKSFIGRLSSLKLSFSDPAWSEAAGFLRELEKAGKDCWKEIALMVWEACKKRYEESSTVEHYWYFGHLMSHYYIADLAFAAQDDILKKVEIADFLKSKILLHGQALDDEAERFWEYNKDARQQRFIKKLGMVYETEKKRTSGVNRRGFEEIPQDCVVIHFYLNKLKKKGYAILAYSDKEWEIKEFPLHVNLFEAFINWQTNYFIHKKRDLESTPMYLIKLCKEIGRVMPFLFTIKNNRVLFVPHDFLHRLPLHAATKNDTANGKKEVFLENHQCYYLPAWSFACKQSTTENLGERILFNGFSENEGAYKDLSELKWKECDNLEKILSPPGLLIVGCHGKADITNPFNTKLEGKKEDKTLLDILVLSMNLAGSRIILYSCETDLVPPLSDFLDEHLSLSSVLLIKGAREVLGGMWIVQDKDMMEIITKINGCCPCSLDIRTELWQWQKQGIRDFHDGENSMFSRSAVFRIIGSPL